MRVRCLIPVVLLVALYAGFASSVAGQTDPNFASLAPSTLTVPPSPADIKVTWDVVPENSNDDFFGYLIHWKVGPSGGGPYNGSPLILGHPVTVAPSPVPLPIDPAIGGVRTYLSGTTLEPEFHFDNLVNNTPDEYYWCVVTAAVWNYKAVWYPTPTANDPSSGVTKHEPDKTSYWDPDLGVSGETVYNIGDASEFSNEVNWKITDGESILVFPPYITGITILQVQK